MQRLALFLCVMVLLAQGAAAQRVEPPSGSLPTPAPTLGAPSDSSVPPSVPLGPVTPELIVDLATPRVSITSAFQGESLLMFGMFAVGAVLS